MNSEYAKEKLVISIIESPSARKEKGSYPQPHEEGKMEKQKEGDESKRMKHFAV